MALLFVDQVCFGVLCALVLRDAVQPAACALVPMEVEKDIEVESLLLLGLLEMGVYVTF